MSKKEKLIKKILNPSQRNNVTFSELVSLLNHLGFELMNVEGSHHTFTKSGIPEKVNIQSSTGGKAKGYQVRQIGDLIKKYGLA